MRDIRVVERARRRLERWEMDALAVADPFTDLLRRKVVAVHLAPGGAWEIEGGAFCGSALIDSGTRLSVIELVPGTIEALFALAEPGTVRFFQQQSAVNWSDEAPDLNPVAARLWGIFLEVAEGYLAMGSGPEKEYTYTTEVSGRPRGKLLLRQSIRDLAAHGIRDRLVCRPISLSIDTERNRLVRLALETIAHSSARSALGRRAELLLFYLRGVALDSDLAFRVRAGRFSVRSLTTQDATAIEELAISVVRGIRLFSDDDDTIQVPFAAFVRIHDLFEAAVFEAVLAWCSRHPGTSARRKAGVGGIRPIFTDSGAIEAEPDVVLSIDERDELLIDAKYTAFSADIRHGNVYQLLSHCGAYAAAEGWLIGVAEDREPAQRYLGATRSGTAIRSLAVDPRSMRSAISDALDGWNMRRSAANAVREERAIRA